MADRQEIRTNLIVGLAPATITKSAPHPRSTFLETSLGMTIWTITVIGGTCPITDMFGFQIALTPDGRRIAMGIGPGSRPGDGPGWKTNPGALLHFIMAGGPKSMGVSAGFRAP